MRNFQALAVGGEHLFLGKAPDLAGKHALVCGASRGIGRAIAAGLKARVENESDQLRDLASSVLATKTITTSISVAAQPASLSVSPDGHWLIAAHYGNNGTAGSPTRAFRWAINRCCCAT